MIDIKKLTPADVGKWVVYFTPFNCEIGRIKGYGEKVVFVVYHCAGQWDDYFNYTAAATDPKDLFFDTGSFLTPTKTDLKPGGKQIEKDDL